MRPMSNRVARGMGLAVGLLLAALLVLDNRMPRGTGTLGADVVFAVTPTGELAITPSGPFLSATQLRPGPEAHAPSGTLEAFNQSPVSLQVHLRGLPSLLDIDEALWVSVESDGRQLFRGPVGDLRNWTSQFLTLASGEKATLTVRTWLPPSAPKGWEGRVATVDLEFRSDVVGA